MAEEKSIVLKIETITDQAVMEAYGKTLNSVLGSYEENTAMISEYNAQIKANQEAIKAIQKEGERWGQLTQKQAQRISNLTAENEKLKIAKSELVQITKNQIKVDNTEVGSMENKSQLLGKLRMAWRKMSDEQKNANQGMLQTIQQLDASLKQADGSIGNFQRNVGDYSQRINGLHIQTQMLVREMPTLANSANQFFMAISNNLPMFADELKKARAEGMSSMGILTQLVKSAFSWQTALVILTTVLAKCSGEIIDWAKSLKGAKLDIEDINKIIEDFITSVEGERRELSLLFNSLQNATEGTVEYEMARKAIQDKYGSYLENQTQEISNLEDLAGAYDLLEGKITATAIAKATADQRAEAIKKYQEAIDEAFTDQNILKQAIKTFGEEYGTELFTRIRSGIASGIPELEAEAKELAKILFPAQASDESFVRVYEALDGKKIQGFVQQFYDMDDALEMVNKASATFNAEMNAINATAKRMSEVLGVTVEDVVEDLKPTIVEIDTSDAFTKMLKYSVEKVDVSSLRNEFRNMLLDMNEEIANDPALARVAESPLARALGVSDKDMKKIENQALQAAGQIFNSIAQLSKEATQRRLQDELDAIDKNAESEKAILEGKLEKGIISQKEYEKKLGEIDEQTAERKEQANKEAFEKQKKWNILQALMNAALAITKTFAEYGGTPMAWVMSAITAATTAAEIAVIASQKYARGGELRGPSHAQGGIKGFVGNRHIEAEGGEVIINKRSSVKHRKLLSLINSDNGWGDDFAHARGSSGRFFARGGVIGGYDFRTSGVPDSSSSLSQFVRQQTDNLRQSFDAINRRIDNLRVSVLLSDIEAKSNEKRVHISRAVL